MWTLSRIRKSLRFHCTESQQLRSPHSYEHSEDRKTEHSWFPIAITGTKSQHFCCTSLNSIPGVIQRGPSDIFTHGGLRESRTLSLGNPTILLWEVGLPGCGSGEDTISVFQCSDYHTLRKAVPGHSVPLLLRTQEFERSIENDFPTA